MYKNDLSLNNLHWSICHKTKPNQTNQMLREDQIILVKRVA